MTKCETCGPLGLNQYRCNCLRRKSLKVRAHLKSVSRKGVLNSARAKRIKSWTRWTEMVKGMSVRDAWRHVYLQGYNAGYLAATRKYQPQRDRRMERSVA